MKILKNIALILVCTLLSYFSAVWFGDVYEKITMDSGSYVDVRFFSGFPLSYIFFLPLLFTAFGNKHKYWWIGLLSIPALAFEFYFDLSHIYIPIILALLGWAIGFGISKVLVKKN